MTIEILITDWEKGQVTAGSLFVDDGKLKVTATPGYENLMENIRAEGKGKEPKKYLDDVLRKYATGSMIRAREKLTVDDAAKLRRIINSVL
jgi:hypothetical protein